MIDYDSALERAAYLHDHGQFTTVPLHKLAERLQQIEAMADYWESCKERPPELMTNHGAQQTT